MNSKNDYTNILLCITLGSIFLIFTYFGSTSYMPFIDIAEVQYILEPKSDLEIGIENTESNYKITNMNEKLKVYNMFTGLKLRKDIFLSKPELNKTIYYIKLKHNKPDGSLVEYKINIFENGIIEINDKMFDTSENIYNVIEYLISQFDNI